MYQLSMLTKGYIIFISLMVHVFFSYYWGKINFCLETWYAFIQDCNRRTSWLDDSWSWLLSWKSWIPLLPRIYRISDRGLRWSRYLKWKKKKLWRINKKNIIKFHIYLWLILCFSISYYIIIFIIQKSFCNPTYIPSDNRVNTDKHN